MYEIPEDLDIQRFVGLVVHSVRFNENQIVFDFEEAYTQIVIEGEFKHSGGAIIADGEIRSPPVSSSSLMQLVYSTVSDCTSPDRRNLLFSFSNGHTFTAINSEYYESFRIYIDHKEFIL